MTDDVIREPTDQDIVEPDEPDLPLFEPEPVPVEPSEDK